MELKYQPIYKCVHKALCINFRARAACSPCVVQDTFFYRFLDDKELCFSFFFLCIVGIFLVFHDKILYYIFMTIFIFYEAPKRSRVFLFHLIQLLINFEKGIRRQLHFLSLQLHLFKKTRNVF